jgi:dUTP pyrophosphatase
VTDIEVPLQRLPHGRDLPLPVYATADAAGVDLLAAVDGVIELRSRARCLVPTGIAIALPSGYEAQLRPRSGLALEHGVTLLNSPGTIDSDYRGEIGVILINLGEEPFRLRRGERIAQLVVAPVARLAWREAQSLPASPRGVGGFGSTGQH